MREVAIYDSDIEYSDEMFFCFSAKDERRPVQTSFVKNPQKNFFYLSYLLKNSRWKSIICMEYKKSTKRTTQIHVIYIFYGFVLCLNK